MRLGFVSAILPDLSFEDVIAFAAAEGFQCVEVMCWPVGKADRRYAGVTHIDVSSFTRTDAARIHEILSRHGVALSALGYYPNPLSADDDEATLAVEHLQKLIRAAALLGVRAVNTFVGRDKDKSVDANWPRFLEVWRPLVELAEADGVRICIENCPMLFTQDEWPGGKNLATSPAIWRRMFADIPSAAFGLNYDPSHLVWQRMDELRPVREFVDRIYHVHAKDASVDVDRCDDVGILAAPLAHHTPRLPGLGNVRWEALLSALRDAGYTGPVCVEVEDRDFEGSLEARKDALRRSAAFLRPLLDSGRVSEESVVDPPQLTGSRFEAK